MHRLYSIFLYLWNSIEFERENLQEKYPGAVFYD